jgi:hypothetical protein
VFRREKMEDLSFNELKEIADNLFRSKDYENAIERYEELLVKPFFC